MDGVISLPIAFASFFMLPDFPHNTRAWYLKESVRYHGRHTVSPFTEMGPLLGHSIESKTNGAHWACTKTTLHESQGGQNLHKMAYLGPAADDDVSITRRL